MPVTLVSLILVTVLGGLTVGNFYWNDLRPDMGRIGANLAQVRDRQRVMLGHFAEAQALLLEQQRRLLEREQDLRRREQAVYEARLEIDAQRAQLTEALRSGAARQGAAGDGVRVGQTGRAGGLAVLRLQEAANLAQTAATGLGRGDDLQAAGAALALATAVLAELPGPAADRGRAALSVAQSRLADIRTVDRAAVAARLQSVRDQAVGLRPVGARQLRPAPRDGDAASVGWVDPVRQTAQSLERQFDAARLALAAADGAGFRTAMEGIDRWLSAFYAPWPTGTGPVLAQVRALAQVPVSADVAPLARALADLADALRDGAAAGGG